MSDEGEVTLSDMVRDTMPQEVTPFAGKEALGKWRAFKGNTVRAQNRIAVLTLLDVELKIKPFIQGANTGERLSF